MQKVKKIGIITIGLLALIFSPLIVFAEQQGIQISPLTYKYEISSGNSEKAKVIIKNLSDTNLNYIMETATFTNVSDEGAPSFNASTELEGVTTLADWINFVDAKEGMLAPKQEKEIYFTIDIPKGAEPGGHYAAVFAKAVKKTAEGKTELGVASRVGTLILVSVPGVTTKTGEIVSSTSPKFVWKGPVDFDLKFKNTGTTHYETPVSVELKPLIGKTSAVDMGKHIVIPNNIRNYTGQWTNKYPFGYYKVTFKALDGNGSEVTQTAVLYAIPLIIVLPVIAGIILLYVLVRVFKSKFKIVTKK